MTKQLAVVGILLLLASPAAAQPADPAPKDGYTLGSGLPLGSSGVRLGGYASTDFENTTEQPAEFAFDDLSLFVFGDIGPRVHFFVEAEETHFLLIDRSGTSFQNNFDLERLYLDYLHADAFKLRVGKFLTPVGSWNEIHPDPLTWTVSRPVASYATFPAFTTGVQAFGTWTRTDRDLDVDYNVFAQYNEAIDGNTGDRHTERMIGGRLRIRDRHVEVGVPIVHYTERDTGDVVTFSGGDLLVHAGNLEIRGEATAGRVRAPAGAVRLEYAAYLQGVFAVTDRFFLVGRQERGHSRDDETYTATSGGLVFRPLPALSLKLEVQGRWGHFFPVEASTGSRVMGGFGVLF